jgi:peptidoglycan hydrolase-like protein with peptidoglycan-binding domain
MSKEHIMTAQESLQDAGFYDGIVDGLFGKASLKAVNDAIKATGYKAPELPDGYVTTNFKMSELTHSNTAAARGISNKPNAEHERNLIESAKKLWQPVRELLDEPMHINSGYRSPAVNSAVGGSRTSAHSVGRAIDFTCPEFGDTVEIAKFLVKELYTNKIAFDQLILEFPNTGSTWIHLGYKKANGEQRNQVLTAKKVNGRTQYFSGIRP